jgi:hypothetical protein
VFRRFFLQLAVDTLVLVLLFAGLSQADNQRRCFSQRGGSCHG